MIIELDKPGPDGKPVPHWLLWVHRIKRRLRRAKRRLRRKPK